MAFDLLREAFTDVKEDNLQALPLLPQGVEPTSVPWFSTSWYTGGGRYRRRRIGLSAFLLIPLTIDVFIVTAIFLGRPTSQRTTGFWGGLLIVSLIVVVTTLYWWRRTAQRDPNALTASYKCYNTASSSGATGTLVRVGAWIAGLFLMLTSIAFLGLLLVLFVRSLTREPDAVRAARTDLECELDLYRDARRRSWQ